MEDLLILDGGTGREISRLGGPFRQPEWSALALYQDPDIVRRIHESFLTAGSNAITTNTHAIVPYHLGRKRYDRDAKRLLKLAVDLAVQAKGERKNVTIMGSIPPISGSYDPGSFDEAIAEPIISDFLEAFRGRVDAIILETMGSAQEAAFALKQIAQAGITCPIYLSFYVEESSDRKPCLLTGDTLTEATSYLKDEGLFRAESVPVVLINCCDIYIVQDALKELKTVLGKENFRIGAYPNAFAAPPSAAANKKARLVNTNISPSILMELTKSWVDNAGASVIGGCCGIGPDHIQALASLKEASLRDPPSLIEDLIPDSHLASSRPWSRTDELAENPVMANRQKSPSSLVHAPSCSDQGCAGCGVQIGFGQKYERLRSLIPSGDNGSNEGAESVTAAALPITHAK